MLRTKQTMRKSTGGKMPRKRLVETTGERGSFIDDVRKLVHIPSSHTSPVSPEGLDEQGIRTAVGQALATGFKNHTNGSYAGSGPLDDAPNPCLNIDGYGSLGLPLNTSEANRLMGVCAAAPFGRGVETVIDTAVRQTWQIGASQIRFDNPSWSEYLNNKVLTRVSTELGVKKAATTARLYKLLLYSEGGHFERHQDTEKEPSMFGTLVMILPSRYSGGEVVVAHRGKEETFDMSSTSAFATNFTCLYTDVYHNVKPVTSGYRLALVYNLVHTAAMTSVPRAFFVTPEMQTLRETLELWRNRVLSGGQAEAPVFVAHLLEQNYSEFGLRFNLLKGRDDIKVGYLRMLADDLGFSVYLTQLKIDVHGYADHEGYDDDGDGYSDTSAPSMVEETEPREYSLAKAIAWDGRKLNLGQVDVASDLLPNIVPNFDLAKMKPDKWEDEGYLGNGAGALDHHYHRTLVLLWPNEYDSAMAIRCAGQSQALRELERRVCSLQRSATATEQERQDMLTLASAIYRCSGDDVAPAIARAGVILGNIELFLKASAGKSLLQIDATIWVSAILAFSLSAIRTHLDAVFRHPLVEAGARDKAARYVAQAFPYDTDIQGWAVSYEQTNSNSTTVEKLQFQERSAEMETPPEWSKEESSSGGISVRTAKRPAVEIIDLTDSPERPAKRRASQ